MKGYRYCYAHERMLQTRSPKLELPAPEDANGIQMAIMRVQKALIDDEISEKKAGLLLYSLQMTSSNLKHTTFTDTKKEVVTEMVVSPESPTSKNETLPLIHTDDTDKTSLPQIHADGRGSRRKSAAGKGKDKCIDPSAALGMTNQSGAAVPHEHRP